MKAIAKSVLLIVILLAIPVIPAFGRQEEALFVDVTGENDNFSQGTPTDPGTLTSITPSAAKQGQSLTVTISGFNTRFGYGSGTDGSFEQGSPTQGSPTVTDVWLSRDGATIDWARGWGFYDTLFLVLFDIPNDANAGKWDVNVEVSQATPTVPTTLTISNGFTVAQPGDITCDGAVNFFDVAVLSNHWLEGTDQ